MEVDDATRARIAGLEALVVKLLEITARETHAKHGEDGLKALYFELGQAVHSRRAAETEAVSQMMGVHVQLVVSALDALLHPSKANEN